MPLILPFFKFNPMDWLTSEKMAQMELHHVGAYINLLSHCWTTGTCTLPSEETVLKKLCRWEDAKYQDFSLVMACFIPYKKTGRVTNPRLYREWEEAKDRTDERRQTGIKGATKRWAPKRTPKVDGRPPTPCATSAQEFQQFWQAYPKKVGKKAAWRAWRTAKDKPAVADILTAVDRATQSEQWRKEQGQFIPNPSTWLTQGRWGDEPLSHGSLALHCPICKTDYPDLAAKKYHDVAYHPKYVG